MIPESPKLLVAGLNYRTAPLTLRETVAFTPAQTEAAIKKLRQQYPQAEVVILSTCNRVEMYLAGPASAAPSLEDVGRFLAEFHSVPAQEVLSHLYHREDRAMVEHLFAVAGSLDSMVVGETQILSQVKHAYHHGVDAGGVGRSLHVLFQRALAAAKDVHENTQLSTGRLSVASVAVDLAASVFDRFDDKTVVCLGAGKMATLMLRHLVELKPGKIVVVNRSRERGEALAREFSAECRAIEELDGLLTEADILLTSTDAAQPIITEGRFKKLLKGRRYRPIVMVDIAVPRDIEQSVAKLTNVYLYNIDDLQEVAAGNRGKREQEIALARARVGVHVEEFLKWFASRDVGPLVKALYEQARGVARSELDAHFAKHPEMTEEKRAELERLAHRLVGKLLHGPVSQLTSNSEPMARPMLAEALRELFELGE